MKLKALLFLCLFLLIPSVQSVETITKSEDSDIALITYKSTSRSESSDGGSSSSKTRNSLMERKLGERDGAFLFEYSFPDRDVAEIEAWKLPAEVLIRPSGVMELENRKEIEARLQDFLEQNPEIKEICGQTIFSWTALSVDCNVDDVLDIVKVYSLHLGDFLTEKKYMEPGVLQAVPLNLESSSDNGLVYKANLILDPNYLRSDYETVMKQVAIINGASFESLMMSTLNLTDGENPTFSGQRVVKIETSIEGSVVKIERETISKIVGGSNYIETRTVSEIIEREPVE